MQHIRALITVAVLAALCPAPASAMDPCLVGTWEPEGNGAAEWVQRQAPGMKMAVSRQAASLHLGADGRYRLHAQVQAAGERDGIRARSDGRFAAQGGWRSADGSLTLTPSSSDTDATTELSGKGGRVSFKTPRGDTRPTTQQYRCRGSELETRMQIPGVTDPIIQRYRRQ